MVAPGKGFEPLRSLKGPLDLESSAFPLCHPGFIMVFNVFGGKDVNQISY